MKNFRFFEFEEKHQNQNRSKCRFFWLLYDIVLIFRGLWALIKSYWQQINNSSTNIGHKTAFTLNSHWQFWNKSSVIIQIDSKFLFENIILQIINFLERWVYVQQQRKEFFKGLQCFKIDVFQLTMKFDYSCTIELINHL